MNQTAEVFFIDSDQAVRLPTEFRFDVLEVFIRHDPITGDVILSRKPTNWQGLIDAVTQNKDFDLALKRRRSHSRRNSVQDWKE
jgi:antitoxin VapB